MSVLSLSRLQFAVTITFHFIFVPLTLGLSILVAWMETKYVRSGDEMYRTMAKFWGRLFLINFALGVVTGITMEFQFGMNWADYSRYVGDIFGIPLAIEATAAFFLESTFVGLWVFGWNEGLEARPSPGDLDRGHRVHSVRLLDLAGQRLDADAGRVHPAQRPGRDRGPRGRPHQLVRLGDVCPHHRSRDMCWRRFFVVGVSAYHLLRRRDASFFKASFRMAAAFGLAQLDSRGGHRRPQRGSGGGTPAGEARRLGVPLGDAGQRSLRPLSLAGLKKREKRLRAWGRSRAVSA